MKISELVEDPGLRPSLATSTTNKAITAKFIECRPTPLPELFHLRAKLRAQCAELEEQQRTLRSRLAKKARALKAKAHHRGRINGMRRERQALIATALELDVSASAVMAQSHLDSLETIRSVCLSVFGDEIELQSQLLQSRLRQNFETLIASGLSRIKVHPQMKKACENLSFGFAQLETDAEIASGKALLETKSGKIEIDIFEDLASAFQALKNKLEDMLEGKV